MKTVLGHKRLPIILLAAMLVTWPFGALANSGKLPPPIAIIVGLPAILIFLVALIIWIFSGWKGIYVLFKKGYLNVNVGWLGLLLLLVFGWWFIIIVWELGSIAGPFLYKYAINRPAKPRCPACKTLNAVGVTKCCACGSAI